MDLRNAHVSKAILTVRLLAKSTAAKVLSPADPPTMRPSVLANSWHIWKASESLP